MPPMRLNKTPVLMTQQHMQLISKMLTTACGWSAAATEEPQPAAQARGSTSSSASAFHPS